MDTNYFGCNPKSKFSVSAFYVSLHYPTGDACVKHDLLLYIDGEFTYTNPAISWLTLALMTSLNQERAVVRSTQQCYLKVGWTDVCLIYESVPTVIAENRKYIPCR